MQIGAQLLTRDGRRIGNAVTFDREQLPCGEVALVVTETGKMLRLTRKEVEDLFYPPVCVMDMTNHLGVAQVVAGDTA